MLELPEKQRKLSKGLLPRLPTPRLHLAIHSPGARCGVRKLMGREDTFSRDFSQACELGICPLPETIDYQFFGDWFLEVWFAQSLGLGVTAEPLPWFSSENSLSSHKMSKHPTPPDPRPYSSYSCWEWGWLDVSLY